MKVIVSGATGFLGGALCARLLAHGHQVTGLGRDPEKLAALASKGASALQVDLSTTAAAVGDHDAFVHCAALSSPWGHLRAFEAANVAGTANALAMAKAAACRRFVQISTPSVYFRFEDQLAVREDAVLPPPVNAYAATKLAAEQLVLEQRGLDTIILRPRGLYGAGDTALLPRLLAVAARRPLPLMRDGCAIIDLTHVDDVVGAIVAALQAPSNLAQRVFNISGGVGLNVRAVAEAAGDAAGVAVRWRSAPVGLVMAAARIAEGVCNLLPGRPEPPITAYSAGLFAYSQTLDITAAAKLLNWTPEVGFEEGLRRTFEAKNQ